MPSLASTFNPLQPLNAAGSRGLPTGRSSFRVADADANRSFAQIAGLSQAADRNESQMAGSQRRFASIISRDSNTANMSASDRARQSAEQFVSIAFVEPTLKALRETNQAAAPFKPSRAEQQFRSMADAQLAQEIVTASSFGLVDTLAQQMLSKAQGAHTAPGVPDAERMLKQLDTPLPNASTIPPQGDGAL